MKRTIKLTESKLRDMIQEAVNDAMAQRKPMRKTQPKRLTENRLRAMIQESVKKALNELDARTYASHADKRQAQADNARRNGDKNAEQLGWKATKGRYAATNAWNKQYGRNFNSCNDRTGVNHQVFMQNGDYTVNDNYWENDYDGAGMSNSTKNNTLQYDVKGRNKYGQTTHSNQGVKQDYDGSDKGEYVAKQTENGTGTYVKGKGWQ